MRQVNKARFVKGVRGRSVVEQMTSACHGPSTLSELRGMRDRKLRPGRRYFANRSRTARPGANPKQQEVDAFFVVFLEIGETRLPQTTLAPVIKQVCTILGWRKYVGKSRAIACRIQPCHMKRPGATNATERQRIDDWDLAMQKKCRDLQDELNADLCEFAN